jgi:hypothetical protein
MNQFYFLKIFNLIETIFQIYVKKIPETDTEKNGFFVV